LGDLQFGRDSLDAILIRLGQNETSGVHDLRGHDLERPRHIGRHHKAAALRRAAPQVRSHDRHFPRISAGAAKPLEDYLSTLVKQRAVPFRKAHVVADLQANADAAQVKRGDLCACSVIGAIRAGEMHLVVGCGERTGVGEHVGAVGPGVSGPGLGTECHPEAEFGTP